MDISDCNILNFLELTMTTDQTEVRVGTKETPQDPLRVELAQEPVDEEVQGQPAEDRDQWLSKNTDKQIVKSGLTPAKFIRSKPLTTMYNCKECSFATMNRNRMQKHQDAHSDLKPTTLYNVKKTGTLKKEFKCPHCSFNTKSYCGLRIHMNIHLNAKPFKCVDCDYRGKDIKELIEHHKDGHAKNKVYICNVCSYTTMYKDRLLEHIKTHSKT